MVQAQYISRSLQFFRPAGTSRGVLNQKPCWYIKLIGKDGASGIGEVSFIPGLSIEDPDEMEIRLDHICKLISRGEMNPAQSLPSLPGIQFALETALKDLESGVQRILYPSDFTGGQAGIPTNGLIWMGDLDFMMEQIGVKIESGFRVLKLKVGALDFNQELEVLRRIRSEYGSEDLEIRLDANGAWSPDEAPGRLDSLAAFGIHSIEQPIAAGQAAAMAGLCRQQIISIALDEELIGITATDDRINLLEQVKPQYIILKPGLLGGVSEAEEWIRLVARQNTGWWVTSALESNIGLNAIAQWTAQLGVTMPQGLGTGSLFSNNIPSPLQMEGESLWYRSEKPWDLETVQF
ncbi:MAG: o-succinylbenzoate synthase [Bacteroidetes bacterium]|nr:o-succinylbenzoate synthase [Bacteroidota bacterium]